MNTILNNLNVLPICFIASMLILRITPNDKIREMGKFYKQILPSVTFKRSLVNKSSIKKVQLKEKELFLRVLENLKRQIFGE